MDEAAYHVYTIKEFYEMKLANPDKSYRALVNMYLDEGYDWDEIEDVYAFKGYLMAEKELKEKE